MATTIKLKNGSGAPLAGDLVQGEPALDLTNKRLYTEDSGGTVIEVGTNPTSLTTGTFTSTGIDDNATSTAITIDSSENVGIGTASPSTKLHLGGTAPLDSIIRQDSTASGTNWEIGEREAGKWQIWEDDSDSVVATFTSSGLVGIGTTSPISPLSVVAAAGGGAIDVFGRSADGLGWISFKTNNGSASHSLIGTPIADTLAFYTNGFNERMRIDASGNLLVGTTSTTVGAGGSGVKGFRVDGATGIVQAAASSSTSAIFNRTTDDGDIAQFRKDGTTVGSIASRGGNGLVINSENSYDLGLAINGTVQFYAAPLKFYPNTDNNADLGGSSNRFKDLYLSGKLTNNGTGGINIDTSGNVGIGTSSPSSKTEIVDKVISTSNRPNYKGTLCISDYGNASSVSGGLEFHSNAGGGAGYGSLIFPLTDGTLGFATRTNSSNWSERMRITSSGELLVGTTTVSVSSSVNGFTASSSGNIQAYRSGNTVAYFNRNTNDGTIVSLRQADVEEGTIAVSGTTVSYNGGHLSRWSQSDTDDVSLLYKGTVMSNLDEMCEWDNEDNEQLNKTKVSDVEGDVNVAGVFVAEDNSDDLSDYYLAMTGDMIIRIAQGTTVQRGDLLMSAGDGTAKPQDDDIVRSKTIAKVTSANVTCTYADGSYCVPCVLMAC